ncbi:MAG: sugar transferase [Candidatus Latescibacteria bacterium]|nr:sugar transferase [Candidatus Latescibacterota bacterium]
MKEDAVAYSAVVEDVLPSAPTLYLVADTSRLNGWGGSLKRLLDIVLAGGAVLVLSPLLLVLALLVRRSSPGPVFFVQERIGKNSQPFPFYKFRTMVHKSDDAIHRQFAAMFINGGSQHSSTDKVYKLTEDPRVTGIGRWLRKTSLDELPQLFNILRGEMSLVGPRPPIAYELDLYQPWHHERLRITPGLTGLWQVSGRSNVPFEEMVRLDIHYINSWSLGQDVRIMFKTVPVVLRGTGGY